MKVELENIVLAHSELSDSVFAGIPLKDGIFRHKKNVTDNFLSCVISRWENQIEVFCSGDSQWEISVKKIK